MCVRAANATNGKMEDRRRAAVTAVEASLVTDLFARQRRSFASVIGDEEAFATAVFLFSENVNFTVTPCSGSEHVP